MLKIKFSRVGKTGQQEFRVIVQEHTKDPWGKFLENLGMYNPRTKKATLKTDRIKEYISKGAQLTDTVHNLFVSLGIVEGKKHSVSHLNKGRRQKMADELKKQEDEKKAAEEKAKAEVEAKKAAEEAAKAAEEAAKAAPAAETTAAEAPAAETPATEAPNA